MAPTSPKRTTPTRKPITELEGDDETGTAGTVAPTPPAKRRAVKKDQPPPPSPEDLGEDAGDGHEATGTTDDGASDVVPTPPAPPSPRRASSYSRIIEGVMSIDIDEAHAEVMAALGPSEPKTGAELQIELDRLPVTWQLASDLAARARADYEKEKERIAQEIEPMKDAATTSLNEEKAAGTLKKQITEAMVVDRVRAVFGDKYLALVQEQRELGAAVHVLEGHPQAIMLRLRSLEKMSEIRGNLGSMPSRDRPVAGSRS